LRRYEKKQNPESGKVKRTVFLFFQHTNSTITESSTRSLQNLVGSVHPLWHISRVWQQIRTATQNCSSITRLQFRMPSIER